MTKATRPILIAAILLAASAAAAQDISDSSRSELARAFIAPPDASRPGVYWYFMDGNQAREAMTADLRGHAQGGSAQGAVPGGQYRCAPRPGGFHERGVAGQLRPCRSHRRPNWAWKSFSAPAPAGRRRRPVDRPGPFDAAPARQLGPGHGPRPVHRHPSGSRAAQAIDVRRAFPGARRKRQAWHADVAVLAFPTPAKAEPPELLDVKALYETQPYSIWKHVPRFIPSQADYAEPPAGAAIDPAQGPRPHLAAAARWLARLGSAAGRLDRHAVCRAQHRRDDSRPRPRPATASRPTSSTRRHLPIISSSSTGSSWTKSDPAVPDADGRRSIWTAGRRVRRTGRPLFARSSGNVAATIPSRFFPPTPASSSARGRRPNGSSGISARLPRSS